ncbi:HAD family phosphatase [uncultured Aeromicrobium sp.]|uniref:HAD family hydrolase n=1 Tax=uncultured Aeromicrobium sp. TaxID=337820 RepID=UPI0025E590C4|nr:HAD-IB family phosphatase [uncultured Aeromicrobium sp.]
MSADRPSHGGLHVFDMDGTLLRSTATIELARQMGRLEVGRELETLWYEGRITDTVFWGRLLQICRAASVDDIDQAFERAPWMEGVAETFADIRARGEDVIVISQSPAFFVRRLMAWGASEAHGSAVEPGQPLTSSATLSSQTKVAITRSALASRGLPPHRCVVYGDSSSDVDLFATFTQTVAVNPSPRLASMAATTYRGSDIREAYALGRRFIASSPHHLSQGSSSA